jgi:polyphenol oxidase
LAPQLSSSSKHNDPSVLNRSQLDVLRVPSWENEGWLLHGFSTRSGDLNLGHSSGDSAERISRNRSRYLDVIATGGRAASCGLVTLKQMHSALARRVGRSDVAERASMWGDGLMTDEPGVLLGIQTADCLPVLVADRKRRAVAAFHAGWRGTLKGVVERGVASMREEFGCAPEDMIAAIGPGIGSCCFTVGAEVRDLFAAKFSYEDKLFIADEKLRMDLVEANRRQLLSAGLSAEAIFAMRECTSCRTDRFFSYRAERGKTGRMMAVIGIAA